MFSSITSYLFGATDPETESNGTQEEATQEPTTPTPNLETTPTEDEWILVEKAGTSRMETSSMENLLIEHPSMSVYHHRGRQSSTGMESENSESSTEEESGKTESSQAGLSRHQPPHRPRALAARIGLQAKTVKSMQKAHQRQSHKDLSKNNLRRVNHNQGKHVCKHVVHQPRQRSTTVAKKQ